VAPVPYQGDRNQYTSHEILADEVAELPRRFSLLKGVFGIFVMFGVPFLPVAVPKTVCPVLKSLPSRWWRTAEFGPTTTESGTRGPIFWTGGDDFRAYDGSSGQESVLLPSTCRDCRSAVLPMTSGFFVRGGDTLGSMDPHRCPFSPSLDQALALNWELLIGDCDARCLGQVFDRLKVIPVPEVDTALLLKVVNYVFADMWGEFHPNEPDYEVNRAQREAEKNTVRDQLQQLDKRLQDGDAAATAFAAYDRASTVATLLDDLFPIRIRDFEDEGPYRAKREDLFAAAAQKPRRAFLYKWRSLQPDDQLVRETLTAVENRLRVGCEECDEEDTRLCQRWYDECDRLVLEFQYPTPASSDAAQTAAASSGQFPCYQFELIGDTWHLRFDGEYGTFSRDKCKGFAIIHALLEQPGVAITARELMDVIRPKRISRKSEKAGNVVADDLHADDSGRIQQKIVDVLPNQTFDTLCDELDRLDAEIERFDKQGNSAKVSSLTNDKQKCLDYVEDTTGHKLLFLRENGYERIKKWPVRGAGRLKSENDNARLAVLGNLTRAYKRLLHGKSPLTKAEKHLHEHIKTEGTGYAYRGANLPDWQFDTQKSSS
jgi:hypothetical protein